jgi:replication factor C subunit 2/4
MFRFKPINCVAMKNKILDICICERIELQVGALQTLCQLSSGDLRKAITLLQSAVQLEGPLVRSNSLSKIAGHVPEEIVKKIWNACYTGRFEEIHQSITEIIASGYSAHQFLSQTFEQMCEEPHTRDLQCARISMHLTIADKALSDGSDDYIQIMSALSSLGRHLNPSV